MSEFSKRRVNIVYKLSLLTMIISVLWFFLARSLDLFELSRYIGVTVPFFVLSAVISRRGNLTVARFIYLIAFNLSVAITSSFIGKAGSVEFILMFAMGLPFFIFFFSKGKNVYRYFSVVINGALVSSVRNRFQLVYNYEAGCPDGRKVHLSDFHSHHLNFHHLSIGVLFGE